MVKSVAAMPVMKRVNRIVTIPKVARSARQNTISIMAAQAKQQNKQAPVVQAQQQKVRPLQVGVKAVPAVSVPKGFLAKKISKGLVTKYAGNEISDTDKEKIRRLRNVGAGKILIIIGNGPSILEADLRKLVGKTNIDIMSVNKPDTRIWPTKYWLFCDQTQYSRNEELWKKYEGILFNTTAIKNKKTTTHTIKNLGNTGFSLDLINGFHIGRSSVFAAMQVAYWLGYSHTYIFGCDMTSKVVNGQELVHFYGVNPDVKPDNRKGRFDGEAKHYAEAGRTLPAAIRQTYTFCSSLLRYDFVDKFNKMDHIIAVNHILKHATNLENDSNVPTK